MVQVSWIELPFQAAKYLRKLQCNFTPIYVPKPENNQPNLLSSRVACLEKRHNFFIFFFPLISPEALV